MIWRIQRNISRLMFGIVSIWGWASLLCRRLFSLHCLLFLLPTMTKDSNGWPAIQKFLQRTKRQPHVTKITPYLVSFGDKTGQCWLLAQGCLNYCAPCMDVALHLWFACWWFFEIMQASSGTPQCTFWLCVWSTFVSEKNEAEWASMHGTQFLQEYAHFALSQYQLRKPHLFPLYPKMHYIDHIFKRLRWEADDCDKAFNCLSTSCQMDEDAVGKSSRISRRVNIRLVQRRTLERYLLNCYAVWGDQVWAHPVKRFCFDVFRV